MQSCEEPILHSPEKFGHVAQKVGVKGELVQDRGRVLVIGDHGHQFVRRALSQDMRDPHGHESVVPSFRHDGPGGIFNASRTGLHRLEHASACSTIS
jgi:hypothetical protein